MKKINNYHELAVEKQRLQQRLTLLKREMDLEVDEIKRRLRPITKIVSMFGGGGDDDHKNGSTSGTGNLLRMGASLGVDLLVGPKLRKAGWLARTVVPPLLRGISSGVISAVNKFRKKK